MAQAGATFESIRNRMGGAGRVLGAVALFLFAAWAELALLFKTPFPPAVRTGLAAVVALVFLAAAVALVARRLERVLLPLAGVLIVLIGGWWVTLSPTAVGQWPSEVQRGALIAIRGDDVEVRNVRTFRWNGPTTADERWEDRIYSLSDLKSADLFVTTPKNSTFDQSIVSFVFGAGPPLALSLELRADKGDVITALPGMFKKYSLGLIAADESDTLKMRALLRGERVHRYPLPLKTDQAAKLLTAFARRSQSLNEHPEFFHTLLNGGAQVVTMMRAAGLIPASADYRSWMVGKDAEILFDLGVIEKAKSFDEARKRADITERIRHVEYEPDFSAALRR